MFRLIKLFIRIKTKMCSALFVDFILDLLVFFFWLKRGKRCNNSSKEMKKGKKEKIMYI